MWQRPDLEPTTPDFLIGTKIMATSPVDYKYAHEDNGNVDEDSTWYTTLPYERTFHLAGFADGVDRTKDTLLVMSGWDSPGAPGEVNSIRMFRMNGHAFLERTDGDDQRKPRPGRFYQNSLVVETGRASMLPPGAGELLDHYDGPRFGIVASRLSDFQGTDWDRNVFWNRDGYFAVIDVCHVKEPGQYNIVDQWWTADVPQIHEGRLVAPTGAGTFYLAWADGSDISLNQWWDGGPYQLKQSKPINARGGEQVTFLNLFYVDSPGKTQAFDVWQAAPTAMVIDAAGDENSMPTLIGVGDDRPTQLGDITIAASRYVISADRVVMLGTARLEVAGQAVQVDDAGHVSDDDRERLGRALLAIRDHVRKQGDEAPSRPSADGVASNTTLQTIKDEVLDIATSYESIGGVSFVEHEDGQITWDLGVSQPVTFIEGIRTDRPEVALQVGDSLDALKPVSLAVGKRQEWVYYQYGYAAAVGVQQFGPLNEGVRYIRVPDMGDVTPKYGRWVDEHWHKQPWNVTGHNQLMFNRPFWQDVVFRSARPQVGYLRTVVRNLDGDGTQELLVATDQRELLAIDAEGRVLWKRQFKAPVRALIVEPLVDAVRPSVIASTFDHTIHVLDPAGQTAWEVDLFEGDTKPRGANALSVYEEDGKRYLIAATYHQCRWYDAQGNQVDKKDAPAFYLDAMPSVSKDITNDGKPDFYVRDNAWGMVSVIQGGTRQPAGVSRTNLAGRGLGMTLWDYQGQGKEDHALAISETGVAILAMEPKSGKEFPEDAAMVIGGIKTESLLPMEQVVDWTKFDAEGEPYVLLGSRYGAVALVDRKGRIAASHIVGSEVKAVAVLPRSDGTWQVIASTGDALVVMDGQLQPIGRLLLVGRSCERLAVLKADGEYRVVGLFTDGRVQVMR